MNKFLVTILTLLCFTAFVVLILIISSTNGEKVNVEYSDKKINMINANIIEYCHDGLVVVGVRYSNYRNGFFYKRSKYDNLIECNTEK